MSFEDTLKTFLMTDDDLLAVLTGGIYAFTADTGRLGYSKTKTPNAYDSNGFMKPCLIIHSRSTIPQNNIPDEDMQYVDTKTVAELYFYTDGAKSGTPLLEAADLVYFDLQYQRISGEFKCEYSGDPMGIDNDPANTQNKFYLVTYDLISFKG